MLKTCPPGEPRDATSLSAAVQDRLWTTPESDLGSPGEATRADDVWNVKRVCRKGTKDDSPRAVAVYSQRPAVEQQNRDLKSHFLLRKLHLKNTARMERMWLILGIAFYISYCNKTAHEPAFVERMSRRYKDGRHDLS